MKNRPLKNVRPRSRKFKSDSQWQIHKIKASKLVSHLNLERRLVLTCKICYCNRVFQKHLLGWVCGSLSGGSEKGCCFFSLFYTYIATFVCAYVCTYMHDVDVRKSAHKDLIPVGSYRNSLAQQQQQQQQQYLAKTSA